LRALKPIITLFALAAIAFGIYYLFFPPAEKVIRKRLGKLATAISTRPQGNIATIANVNKIGSFFHPNVSITVEGFGREFGSVQGRGELQQTALAARQRVGAVSVELYNIKVQVGPGETNATASATALVKVGDETNPAVQELIFQFEKYERDWLIRSATPAKPSIPL
jgi:hypothetical protein